MTKNRAADKTQTLASPAEKLDECKAKNFIVGRCRITSCPVFKRCRKRDKRFRQTYFGDYRQVNEPRHLPWMRGVCEKNNAYACLNANCRYAEVGGAASLSAADQRKALRDSSNNAVTVN
jgi:hypothetical protein